MTREEMIKRAQLAPDPRQLFREDAEAVVDALAVVEMYEALEDAEKRLRGAGMLGGSHDDPVLMAIAKVNGWRS